LFLCQKAKAQKQKQVGKTYKYKGKQIEPEDHVTQGQKGEKLAHQGVGRISCGMGYSQGTAYHCQLTGVDE